MIKMNLNLIGVSAYMDSSYNRDRELWRGFLGYALPFFVNIQNLEVFLQESMVRHLEQLTACGGGGSSLGDNIRCISVLLAKEIGVDPEFALAAFFEGAAPTKLHLGFGDKKKTQGDNGLISSWLLALSKVQKKESFLLMTAQWKIWFQGYFEEENSIAV